MTKQAPIRDTPETQVDSERLHDTQIDRITLISHVNVQLEDRVAITGTGEVPVTRAARRRITGRQPAAPKVEPPNMHQPP